MKPFFRAALVLGLLALGAWALTGIAAESSGKHYVCAPCGMDCDAKVYDKPGTCPVCGVPLVEQGSAAAQAPATKVAFLIFTGVQPIDYVGPYEIFGAAGYDVYTVAETADPINTTFGMKVVPRHTFADAPQPDVLIVPGGGVKASRESKATLDWIRKTSANAKITMSVCNGAYILASAGLLDGLKATTTAGLIKGLGEEFPKIHLVYDQRFVDNGKIITCGGLTSGMDGAIHVVSRLDGQGAAQQVALGEEYDWSARSGFARASLADRLIPSVHLSEMGTWEVAKTEGSTDRWEIAVRGTSDLTSGELLSRIDQELAKSDWKSAAGSAKSRDRSSHWIFRDAQGAPWQGTVTVGERDADRRYTLAVTIARERPKAG